MDVEWTPMGPFEAMLPVLTCVVVLLQHPLRCGPQSPTRPDGLAAGCSRMTVPEGHLPLASRCVFDQGWNQDFTASPLTPFSCHCSGLSPPLGFTLCLHPRVAPG